MSVSVLRGHSIEQVPLGPCSESSQAGTLPSSTEIIVLGEGLQQLLSPVYTVSI